MAKWIRARFKANPDDFRPIKWPPPGPYWCTGCGDGYSTVVAYVKTEEQVVEYWPEASDIEATDEDELRFGDRFPRPDWFKDQPMPAADTRTAGDGDKT